MTLLAEVPAVHGPFVLRLSRHLSRLLLEGLGSYRGLGALMPCSPCHGLTVMQTPIYTEKEKKMMGQQQIMAEKEACGVLRRML